MIESKPDITPIGDVFTRFWIGVEDSYYAECIYSERIWARATLEQIEHNLIGKIFPNWIPDWTLIDYPARYVHDVRDIYIRSSKLEKFYLLDTK